MGHDQLFKTLLETFLREFLELFFHEVAERLDFATKRLLDKELITDFPEGRLREADVVTELRTREGEPELILVHVEVQAEGEASSEGGSPRVPADREGMCTSGTLRVSPYPSALYYGS